MKSIDKTLLSAFAILSLAIISGAPNSAAAQEPTKAVNPDAMKWSSAPPILPKGAELTVLAGDPTKSGQFTLRLKVPAGYKLPAHSHPTFEAVTVISGNFNIGMGDKLDEAKGQKLGPGGFIYLPENMNHFAFASTDSIVQIDGPGPFAIKYVNPADDPAKQK